MALCVSALLTLFGPARAEGLDPNQIDRRLTEVTEARRGLLRRLVPGSFRPRWYVTKAMRPEFVARERAFKDHLQFIRRDLLAARTQFRIAEDSVPDDQLDGWRRVTGRFAQTLAEVDRTRDHRDDARRSHRVS